MESSHRLSLAPHIANITGAPAVMNGRIQASCQLAWHTRKSWESLGFCRKSDVVYKSGFPNMLKEYATRSKLIIF
jgi:hypothetical protein